MDSAMSPPFRMRTSRQAISDNVDLVREKVVLDLGCGPGHLAMICAQVGDRQGM